jgi:hypothetical protein
MRETLRDRAKEMSGSVVDSGVVAESVGSFEGFATVGVRADIGSCFRVNGQVSFDFRLEFEGFAAVGHEAVEGFLFVDSDFFEIVGDGVFEFGSE